MLPFREAPVARALLVVMAVGVLLALGWRLHPSALSTADMPSIVRGYVHFDGGWYGQIAQRGYWHHGGQAPIAFFPLYPLVIRIFMELGFNRWIAGVLISLVCGVGVLLQLRRWIALVSPGTDRELAMLLLGLYPLSVYLFGVMYSDSLFLLLAISAFVALEEDQVGLATVLGALATATRPVGPAIVLGLVLRGLERRRTRGERVRPIDALPLLAAAGLLAYMAFLWWRFGDPFGFVNAQGAPGWEQSASLETWLKVNWFNAILYAQEPLVIARLVFHAGLTAGALALVAKVFRRLGWGYGVYCLVVVGLPALSSKDFQGLGRYLLAAFPMVIVITEALTSRQGPRRFWLVASGALMVIVALGLGADLYVS